MKLFGNLTNRIKKWYDRLKIDRKFMLIFYLCLMAAVILVMVFMFARASVITNRETTAMINGLVEQAGLSCENLFGKAEETSFRMYTDQKLRDIYERDPENYPYDQQAQDYRILADIYATQMTNRYIDGISMYFANGGFYVDIQWACFSMEDAQKMPWYETVVPGGPCYVSYYDTAQKKAADRPTVSCIRAVRGSNGGTIGYLEVKLNRKYLREVLEDVAGVTGGEVCLVNSAGMVFATSKADDGWRSLEYPYVTELISGQEAEGTAYRSETEHVRLFSRWLNTDAVLLAAVPESLFRERVMELVTFAVATILTATVAALALAYLLSGQITKRIVALSEFMKRASIENEERAVPEKEDEITDLTVNCNRMLDTSRRLYEELDKVNREKREADFRLLQEQINPHFLYNILDSINWMAYRGETKNISKMARLLSAFFRQILGTGEGIVSIRSEIEHVETYLELLKLRYGDAIEFEIRIDDDILDQTIVNMILQPLVENAVSHGIMEKEDSRGKVTISGKHNGDMIVITITDDGVGIDPERLEKITKGEYKISEKGGFGIKNVHDRIRLNYGERSGVVIDSNASGTTVSVVIPFEA